MMTKKEAADELRRHISPYDNCAADALSNEAIEIATKALEQIEDTIPREQLNKAIAEIENLKGDNYPNSYYVRIIKKHCVGNENLEFTDPVQD